MSGKRSAISGSLFIAGTGLGFLNYLLITRRFGIGGATDAYFLCHALGELLIRLLLCQEFQPAYLARYHEAKLAGRSGGSLSATLLWLAALLGPLTLAGIWGTPALVHFLAPGLSAETAQLTALLLRWNLAAMLLQYLAQPLISACYHEGESWVEPGALLLLTAGVSGAVLAPSGTLLLAVQLHVAGFAVMGLLALGRLARRGAAPGAIQAGDFSAAAGFFRSLLPLGSMVVTRSLFRWGYTALLSTLPGGTITLVNFGEKIYGAGVALLTQGFARIAIPPLLRAEPGDHRRRQFLADSAWLSAVLGAALFAAAGAIPVLAISAPSAAQLTLCRDVLRGFSAAVFLGGFWECARSLGLSLRLNRAVTVSANLAHVAALAVMFGAWKGLGGVAASPSALPLYLALACLIALLFAAPRLLGAGGGRPAGGSVAAGPAGWIMLALLLLSGEVLPEVISGASRGAAAAILLLVSGAAGALFWTRLRQSASRDTRSAAP
jgi:hypothetical protein